MEIKCTFENDQLNRKMISDSIEKYLNRMQQKNLGRAVSFAINAKWGEGKTYFISMWKHKIEETVKDAVVYYNAWENDDCDSAILPLLYNIISIKYDETSDSFIKHAQFFLKTLGMNTLKFSMSKFLVDSEKLADIVSSSFEETRKTQIKTIFSEYDEYYGKRKKLQESLKDLIPANGNLWVFIDDLDRCNPSFAINTLECIKHFFNIEHIIFVFAIDYNQLTIAAEQVYGSGINSSSYMKKFFDAIYQLPSPNRYKYIEYKISNVQDENVRRFINAKILRLYFEKFDFSLRDIDLTMTHLELFISCYFEELDKCKDLNLALNVYYYFMSIKDKFNKDYMDLIHGHFSVDSLETNIWPIIDKKYIVNKDIRDLLEKISNGQAERHMMDVMNRYSMIETTPPITKFSDHMEFVLR